MKSAWQRHLGETPGTAVAEARRPKAPSLGRAALAAADEDPEEGPANLADRLALEMRLLISALGKHTVTDLTRRTSGRAADRTATAGRHPGAGRHPAAYGPGQR
ncbi:hypothetical protein ACFQ2B_27415 [Streptomyces stramineus]|uniref:Uncharacterized protein n=1 Tax=Streptomyces stramineus TaxID=173861 RepID=A0ABP3JH38_9ACTN